MGPAFSALFKGEQRVLDTFRPIMERLSKLYEWLR
jgi:hypothetical protein